ncbi:metalloregulator ArsR/SmtB family transcription factor [Hydrogenovibrio sp. 3SP14C1]|uniref:ArsR/SmtB family transcription factor n=1 Tax=Hydrogenovibrio sp. 3SP14C1 TaxID=3038774 RepID=UPI0024163971|nr:metalloregulator ArsR/SmtB family transcription factor [Hydrogenovibrio sp. 3SP14C1]MDG4812631.1 metalloregulator ArsR/SmtB family transcription factor [Hydrogenovibrio sp. 3SP14C1]
MITENKTVTLDNTARLFKALSEPLRLRILSLLLQRETLCVCDLVTVLEQGQSTISRHLNYLKNAGLVNSWREGTWMHYQIEQSALSILNLPQFQTLLNATLECQTDLAALKQYENNPRSCQLTS